MHALLVRTLLLAACLGAGAAQDKVIDLWFPASGPSPQPPTTTAAQSRTPPRVIRLVPFDDAVKVAKSKCAEFAEFVFEEVEENPLQRNTTLVRQSWCAMVGEPIPGEGVLAKHGEFPHMVALGYQPGGANDTISWRCSGSLVSERYVLTAAHCVYTHRKGPVKWAQLGSTQLDDPDAQTLAVAEVFMHPAYSAPAHDDDIALLRLAAEPRLSPRLRPACVGMEPMAVVSRGKMGAALEATGWGYNITGGVPLDNLMKYDLYLAPFEICDDFHAFLKGAGKLAHGINRDSMLCVGNDDPSKDSCQVDSGGPVQSKLNDSTQYNCMYNVAGVASFGVQACNGSLYSNVRHYLPWIVAVVWTDELASPKN